MVGNLQENSYHADKGQLRHDLGGEGAAKDLKATETYPSQVRKCEGQGWAPTESSGKVEYLHQIAIGNGDGDAQASGS